MSNKITVFRGDTPPLKVTFKTPDGVAINLTGTTVFFTAKKKMNDSDEDALISKTNTFHYDAVNGITYFNLTTTDTATVGILYYDIQYKATDGKITTLVKDILEIKADVTQRTV